MQSEGGKRERERGNKTTRTLYPRPAQGLENACTKARSFRSTSHLGNNGGNNGQQASTVSSKHAFNSRESERQRERERLRIG